MRMTGSWIWICMVVMALFARNSVYGKEERGMSKRELASSSNQEVFLLYGLPTLDVTLYYHDFPKAQDDIMLDELIKIGQELDRLTSEFLKSNLEISLDTYTHEEQLHSVQLDVVVRLVSSLRSEEPDLSFGGRRSLLRGSNTNTDNNGGGGGGREALVSLIPMIRSELSGHVAFTAADDNSSTRLIPKEESSHKLSKEVVKSAVLQVFVQEKAAYLNTLQNESELRYLQQVQDVTIGLSANEKRISTSDEPIQASRTSGSGLSSVESVAVFGMGAALIVIVAGSYVYLSSQYHAHRKEQRRGGGDLGPPVEDDDAHLIKHMDSDGDMNMEELTSTHLNNTYDMEDSVGSGSSSTADKSSTKSKSSSSEKNPPVYYHVNSLLDPLSSSNPASNGSGNDAGIVPVPANVHATNNSVVTTALKKVPARRYVHPTSPFDVLYGAAFLHHDHATISQLKKSRSSSNNNHTAVGAPNNTHKTRTWIQPNTQQQQQRNKGTPTAETTPRRKKHKYSPKDKKGASPLTPMMSIAESADEGGSLSSGSQEQEPYSFFPQLMNNITMYLGNNNNNSNEPSQQKQQQQSKGKKKKEDFDFVYRDFPRHDGTPFIMFTPEEDKIEKVPPQVCFPPNSNEGWNEEISQASDSMASSMNSSLKAGIDNFVDKLEKLMAARSRQYEERVKMEKEREKRRSKRTTAATTRRARRTTDRHTSHRTSRTKYHALSNTQDADDDEDIIDFTANANANAHQSSRHMSGPYNSSHSDSDTQSHPSHAPVTSTSTGTSNTRHSRPEQSNADITTQIDDLLNLLSDDAPDTTTTEEEKKECPLELEIDTKLAVATTTTTTTVEEPSDPKTNSNYIIDFEETVIETPKKELVVEDSPIVVTTTTTTDFLPDSTNNFVVNLDDPMDNDTPMDETPTKQQVQMDASTTTTTTAVLVAPPTPAVITPEKEVPTISNIQLEDDDDDETTNATPVVQDSPPTTYTKKSPIQLENSDIIHTIAVDNPNSAKHLDRIVDDGTDQQDTVEDQLPPKYSHDIDHLTPSMTPVVVEDDDSPSRTCDTEQIIISSTNTTTDDDERIMEKPTISSGAVPSDEPVSIPTNIHDEEDSNIVSEDHTPKPVQVVS